MHTGAASQRLLWKRLLLPAMNATQPRQTSAERIVCVFCASSNGTDPIFLEAAKGLGQAIAERRWRLIYGGAEVGLMGAMADAALAAGGRVTGVIPRALVGREIAHRAWRNSSK
jgi:uncharacterized protein (TIGR00730 family)